MSIRTKLILASLAAVLLGFVFLPRLARLIDSAVDPAWEKMAANEARYQDMTNAFRTAGELMPDHPTRRLFEECRATLLKAGYIESREIPMRVIPEHGWSVPTFFTRFRTNFPGVECQVRGNKVGQPPVIVVTARKGDFPAIKQFIANYEPK
jgi:hypothetical protein